MTSYLHLARDGGREGYIHGITGMQGEMTSSGLVAMTRVFAVESSLITPMIIDQGVIPLLCTGMITPL